ncbi:MAG: hypothetical protein ACI86M_000838 [Saprospiraceae bacterium]|jgi:hypothetical protein
MYQKAKIGQLWIFNYGKNIDNNRTFRKFINLFHLKYIYQIRPDGDNISKNILAKMAY